MGEPGIEASADSAVPDPLVRLAFVMNVHRLLQRGFDRMIRGRYKSEEEEVITGALTQAIEQVLEDPNAPEWAIHITIHEEKRKHDGTRRGKKRLRLDFEFERTGRGCRPRFEIEAKRLSLSPKHRVSGYLGPKGMGAFLSGEYAAQHGDAGMVGYMQSHTPEHWRDELAAKLGTSPGKFGIEPKGEWQPVHIAEGPSDTHQTTHRRAIGQTSIVIYHTLLDFRNAE